MSNQLNVLRTSVTTASSDDAGIIMSPLASRVNGRTQQNPDSLIVTDGGLSSSANGLTDHHLAVGTPAVPLARPQRNSAAARELPNATIALIMTSLCLSVTLSALDLTIVTTAVPAIVGSFRSVAGYVWIGAAYILAYAAVIPVWGSVADIWGRKPIMVIAVAIFLAGSLLCALAPDMNALIAGRAIQGLGASGMSLMVNVVISDMFSLRDRGLYLAITSMVWAVGSAIGPVLGGVFTARLNWRWCFWINLPVGAIVLVVLFFFLKVPTPGTPVLAGLKAIDWTGSILIIGGALTVLLGMEFGDVTYPWSSATVISLIVAGAVAVVVFVVNEWKVAANPIIPLRLFSSLPMAAPYSVFACNSYVFIGLAYYLPLYSQSVLGASALSSGLYLLPLIVSTSLAAAFAGLFIQQTGRYLIVMYIAQVALTVGIGLFIELGFKKNLTKLFIFEVIAAIGIGMNIEAPIIAAQAATTVRDTAAVSSTMGFFRSIATAISVVIGGVVFQNQMNAASSQLIDQLGLRLASQFNGSQASANIELIGTLPGSQQLVVRKVFFDALRTVWIMYVAMAGLASVMTLFVRAHDLPRENAGAILGLSRGENETL